MKKVILLMLSLSMLIPTLALSESILEDGWQDASLDELKRAVSLISERIEEKEQALEEQALESSGAFFSESGVTLRFDGMADTHTSGLNFQPAIFFENASDKALSVSRVIFT